MSLELANTLATFGTFVVIAATAIAAIVQLRHARGSNHIAALNELRETQDNPEFQAATQFVLWELQARLRDDGFRYQMATPTARTSDMLPLFGMLSTVLNYYESMGVLVKNNLVDRDLVLDIYSYRIIAVWEKLAPAVTIHRRRLAGVWENFEYLTVLSEEWRAAHPKGTYPSDVRRIDLRDEFLEADKQYAASLAPASA